MSGIENQAPLEIWLQPWCDECDRRAHDIESGRTWCQDPVYDACECGARPLRYVLESKWG